MEGNVSVLQIGVGSMGKRRVRNLQYLGVTNISCYDIRNDRIDEAKGKYNIKTVDYSQINWSEFTHVIISTPPDQHIQYAIDAINQDKHVFIEASVVDELYAELIALHKAKSQLVLAPSCTMRFDPIVVKAKEIIDSGNLGKVIFANHYFGQYLKYWHTYEDFKDFYVSQKSTGAAREIVPFDLVYLVWLLGDITTIASLKKNSQTLGIDIDDIYSIICETVNNVLLQLSIDVVSKVPYRDTRITLQNGNIEINNVKGELNVYNLNTNTWQHYTRNKLMVTNSTEEMYVVELKAFIDATSGRGVFPYSIEEDHKILKYLYTAESASQRNLHLTI
jgi:predicted dehydrogenase